MSSSVNETLKESDEFRNSLIKESLNNFNERQESQRQILDKRIPQSDKTLALISNLVIKKDGIPRTLESRFSSYAVVRFKSSSNKLFDFKKRKRRKINIFI